MMGSGGLIVMDEDNCMVDILIITWIEFLGNYQIVISLYSYGYNQKEGRNCDLPSNSIRGYMVAQTILTNRIICILFAQGLINRLRCDLTRAHS